MKMLMMMLILLSMNFMLLMQTILSSLMCSLNLNSYFISCFYWSYNNFIYMRVYMKNCIKRKKMFFFNKINIIKYIIYFFYMM